MRDRRSRHRTAHRRSRAQICQSPPRSTGTRSPSARDAGDLELGRADHEVDVDLARVERGRGPSSSTGEREAAAERDVARRVLVEQRVVEDRPERADAALPVDERDLAEPRGALVDRDVRARIAPPFSSASTSTARPPSKRTRRPRTIVPSLSTSGFVEVTCPSARCGSGVVKTSSVGRFGRCRRPVARREVAGQPARDVGSRPTVSSVPGPAQLERVEARARSARPPSACSSGDALVPRRRRVGLVEPQDVPELAPRAARRRPRLVELRVDELRPGRVRARDDRPVRRALADRRARSPSATGSWSRPSSAGSRPSRTSGSTTPRERDPRVAALGERSSSGRRTTAGRTSSVVGVGVLDPRALDVRVEVRDVDEERAAPVGRRGDRARELLLPDRRADGRRPGRAGRSRRATASSARASKRSSIGRRS